MHNRLIGLVLVFVCSFSLPGLTEPLTIEQAIESALTSHPSVKIAQSFIDQAAGQRLIDLSPEPASLSVEYEGMKQGQSLRQYEEKRITLSQEFDFPLKYLWRAEATNIAQSESKINALIQILDLEKAVRLAFIKVWAIEEKAKILNENVKITEEYASQLRRMVELGESAPLEARRLNVELLQAISERNSFINERDAVWVTFKNLTGLDSSVVDLVSPVSSIQTFGSNQHSGNDLKNSPELVSADLQTKLANIESKSAFYGWLPDFEISYFRQQLSDAPNPDFWGVEFGVTLPVWFWLGGRGEVKSKQANYQSVSADQQKLLLEKQSDLILLHQTYIALLDEVNLYSEQVNPLAQEAYELSLKSYKLGDATYLEVLDAQRTFLDVKLAHLEKQVELLNVTSDIDRLTGQTLVDDFKLFQDLSKGNKNDK